MANRAPRMVRHVGPEPQACGRDATSCERLGAADESFNRATRLGPSPNALWMGQKEASVQDTRSGYHRGGLARGADKASGRPHAPCARGRQAGCAKPSPKGAVRLGVPSRGKLHGGAPAASVRSRCDVLQAAVAPPMGARALLRRSNRRGPARGQGARMSAQTCLLCCAAAGRLLSRRAALPDPKVWAALQPTRGNRPAREAPAPEQACGATRPKVWAAPLPARGNRPAR